jgi:hypothetical protein
MKFSLREQFSNFLDEPIQPSPSPIIPMESWAVVDKKELRKSYSFSNKRDRDGFFATILSVEDHTGRGVERTRITVQGMTVYLSLMGQSGIGLTKSDKEFALYVDGIYKDFKGFSGAMVSRQEYTVGI